MHVKARINIRNSKKMKAKRHQRPSNHKTWAGRVRTWTLSKSMFEPVTIGLSKQIKEGVKTLEKTGQRQTQTKQYIHQNEKRRGHRREKIIQPTKERNKEETESTGKYRLKGQLIFITNHLKCQ